MLGVAPRDQVLYYLEMRFHTKCFQKSALPGGSVGDDTSHTVELIFTSVLTNALVIV